MEITTLQIVLVFVVACIAGMESVLDEFQFHRPLVGLYVNRYRAG
ncbi:PTS system sorbose-specific transporter subunit IIC [Pseudescherichia vulneris]|nr:PTS system sorbose-specific transporter subunit IIC [Pseudescherichia vulneris]